jgi:hypothetical protein
LLRQRNAKLGCHGALDNENKTRKNTTRTLILGAEAMKLLIREGAALVSVSAFVWMVCSAAHLVA